MGTRDSELPTFNRETGIARANWRPTYSNLKVSVCGCVWVCVCESVSVSVSVCVCECESVTVTVTANQRKLFCTRAAKHAE